MRLLASLFAAENGACLRAIFVVFMYRRPPTTTRQARNMARTSSSNVAQQSLP